MDNILFLDSYIIGCMDNKSYRGVLASNIKLLMESRNWSQRDLAKKANVAAMTVNNLLSENTAASIDNIAKVSKAFGLEPWHLLMPNLPPDVLNGARLERLINNYVTCSPEARVYIDTVSEREGS